MLWILFTSASNKNYFLCYFYCQIFRIVDNKFKNFNQSLVNIADWKPDL